jgi:hypothetical protein
MDFVAPEGLFDGRTGMVKGQGCPSHYSQPEGVVVFATESREKSVDC